MNLLLAANMEGTDLIGDYCVVCGHTATDRHHVVPRSQGGASGPRLSLCGFGNTSGCHGEAHERRLHFRWRDGWEVLRTEPMKYEQALDLPGWERI